MAESLRAVASECLNKPGTFSVRRDILGVYGSDNPRNRSVLSQLDRIRNLPHVKLALVTLEGIKFAPQIQRNLDTANDVWLLQCGAWVYPTASIKIDEPHLQIISQDDCDPGDEHSVSDDEDELFHFGRNLGANVVCYHIQTDTGNISGCAVHPPGRRGFWVAGGASRWVFAHELTHLIGNNFHIDTNDACNLGNLMTTCGASNIEGPNPDLTEAQCGKILGDDGIEQC